MELILLSLKANLLIKTCLLIKKVVKKFFLSTSTIEIIFILLAKIIEF